MVSMHVFRPKRLMKADPQSDGRVTLRMFSRPSSATVTMRTSGVPSRSHRGLMQPQSTKNLHRHSRSKRGHHYHLCFTGSHSLLTGSMKTQHAALKPSMQHENPACLTRASVMVEY